MKVKRWFTIAGMLALALSVLIPYNAMAEEPLGEDSAVTPNIVFDKGDSLLISYSENVESKKIAKEQLDAYLDNVFTNTGLNRSTNVIGGGMLRDSYYYQEGRNVVYIYGDQATLWAGTGCSSDNSFASFAGSSSAAWYGDFPAYNCDNIYTPYYMNCQGTGAVIRSAPSGWWYMDTMAGSGANQYSVNDTWYLGTSWSGLTAMYSVWGSMSQTITAYFSFDGYSPWQTNVSYGVYFGL